MNAALQVSRWNAKHPLGMPVRYRPSTKDDGIETRTRSAAWELQCGDAVVLVEGVSGCVGLDWVEPLTSQLPQV